jgi:hypothetical protein
LLQFEAESLSVRRIQVVELAIGDEDSMGKKVRVYSKKKGKDILVELEPDKVHDSLQVHTGWNQWNRWSRG